MNDVGKSGRTILFVSHNMAAVENLCTRGVLISSGRIGAAGPVERIVAEYQKRDRIVGQATIDLANHPNRRGGAVARLKCLHLATDGHASSAVRMGEPLELVIDYDCGRKPVELKLGICIEDHRGVKVANLATVWQAPQLLRSTAAQSAVSCIIRKIVMVSGSYAIHIYYDDGVETECVENACEIEVLPADVFDTGRVPEARYGLIYMDCNWSMARLTQLRD
jgi:lipopolysaccharide transport system ATP-binding protein